MNLRRWIQKLQVAYIFVSEIFEIILIILSLVYFTVGLIDYAIYFLLLMIMLFLTRHEAQMKSL